MASASTLIHDGVVFHGVAELLRVPGERGLRLQRVPEGIRLALNEKAARRILAPDGAEIRFVSDGTAVEVTLSSPTAPCELIPFWGDFQGLDRHTIGPEPTTIRLEYPERLQQLKPEWRKRYIFDFNVWRLTLRGLNKHGTVFFHKIQGQGLRPPARNELPSRTYLAYGTSVTDGFSASAMHLTYIAQTARRLGADLINLGMAGAALCEPPLADYIADRKDWHLATLCISANMIGAGFSVEAFRERAGYMIDAIAAADPSRPVVCITIWPYAADFCHDGSVEPHRREIAESYRQALRDLVRRCGRANVYVVEGGDLLRDITGYTVDLMHPGDAGMTQIAENLARRIAPLLD